MSNFLHKLKKLRGRSFDELRVRGGQFLAAELERRGWSEQVRVPSDIKFFKLFDENNITSLGEERTPVKLSSEVLFSHFRTRASPHFFAAFDDREATLSEWRRRWSCADSERLIEHATRIANGHFDLLGLKDLAFGSPPDWHLEPASNKRAPYVHWSKIDFLNNEIVGDKKITWELNRCQYFLTLGRAYWLTGDEKYAEVFATHFASWMDANPPKLGINWTSSLEVAFRAIGWIWSLYFFKDSTHLTPQLFTRILKFIYIHAQHLETYLSTYFSPNTHLTGEALGLFYIGTLFPEFKRAQIWRETGRRILVDALSWQVRDDGVYFEQTSYYHRYTVDFYTHLLTLARRNKIQLPSIVETKLQMLLEHLMHITRPDGTTPFYGDDDGGRLVMLDERACVDFRAAVSNGAILFRRGDYKFVAREAAEESLWLFGADGAKIFDTVTVRQPHQTSRAFRESGYFALRDAWSPDANFMLIDCGAHGAQSCGHAHADALSFDVSINGRAIFTDIGTYTYTGSRQARNYFRSTLAHNTLTIDDESQSTPSEQPFVWKQTARTKVKAWRTHERFNYFAGNHDGYLRLAQPALHTRRVLFLKNDYFIVRDTVRTTGAHKYELCFHCAPQLKAVLQNNDALLSFHDADETNDFETSVRLSVFDNFARGAWRVNQGWVSPCYGAVEEAQVLSYCLEAQGNAEFISFMCGAREAVNEGRRMAGARV